VNVVANQKCFCIKQAIIESRFFLDQQKGMNTGYFEYCSLLSLPFCMCCHPLLDTQDKVKKIFDNMINAVQSFEKKPQKEVGADAATFWSKTTIPFANNKERKLIVIEQYLYLLLFNEIAQYEKDYEKLGIVYAFCSIVESVFRIKIDFFDMPMVEKVYNMLNHGDIEKLSYKEFLIALRVIIVNNGDVLDFLLRSYCTRFDITQITFSRSVLTHGSLGFKMMGYSLDEGDAEYYVEHSAPFRDIIPYVEDGTYFFERKIIGKIITKFGAEKFKDVSKGSCPTNIFDLSQSFIDKPCLYYELIKYTDEGMWKEAMNIIDKMEVS
jgi:hypothetical protein